MLAFCSPIENVKNKPILRQLVDAGIRVVHIDIYNDSIPEGDYCIPDYVRAGRAAATRLMLKGYENFYYCGYGSTIPVESLLEKGFLEAISDQGHGTAERRELFSTTDSSNYFQLREYGHAPEIEDRPDVFLKKLGRNSGIFCGTKARAVKLMEIIRKNNLRVPEDVGIIGVEMLYEYGEDRSIDYLSFDRMTQFQIVIDTITKFHFDGIRRLVPPKMINNGTVRTVKGE